MTENSRHSERFQVSRRGPYRSFFWPLILMGIGVIALLINLDIIPRINLWSLWRLWPVLLIVAGLDILFARRWPAVGALLGLAVVGLVIVLLILAPTLGWESAERLEVGGIPISWGKQEVKSGRFSEPIGSAEFATVDVDLTSFDATVTSLVDSSNLIEVRVDYFGRMRFDVSGTTKKQVFLDEIGRGVHFFGPISDRAEYSWDIRLSPDLAMDLIVDASSGSCDMELSQLDLERLVVEGSSGDLTVALPGTRYGVRFDASSGDARFEIPRGADVTFELEMSSGRVELILGEEVDLALELDNASSGDLVLNVPRGAAMKVAVADSSSGIVRLPSDLRKTREGDERDEGIWETQGFDSADHQMVITVEDMSSGDVIVEYE